MSDKLDKIDFKILKILQENSKITNLDLSKKIGLREGHPSPHSVSDMGKKIKCLKVNNAMRVPYM